MHTTFTAASAGESPSPAEISIEIRPLLSGEDASAFRRRKVSLGAFRRSPKGPERMKNASGRGAPGSTSNEPVRQQEGRLPSSPLLFRRPRSL